MAGYMSAISGRICQLRAQTSAGSVALLRGRGDAGLKRATVEYKQLRNTVI
jgi:hypothetical protein